MLLPISLFIPLQPSIIQFFCALSILGTIFYNLSSVYLKPVRTLLSLFDKQFRRFL